MATHSTDDDRETDRSDLTRREFLNQSVRKSSVVGAGLALGASGWPAAAALGLEDAAASGDPRIRQRVQLGRTGIEIPDISFGTFSLEDDGDERLIHHALDRGITHFDSAEGYTKGRSETLLGRALRGRRNEVTLTSKFWAKPHHSAEHQMRMLEKSLRRLQTDHIDIYLNHAVNDVARLENPEWQSFIALAKKQGKIRAAGMSGHAGRLTECLTYALDKKLVDVVLVAYNFIQEPGFREKITRYLKDLAENFDLVTTHPELPLLLARAHAEGVGVMTMKTLRGARKNDLRSFEAPGRTFAQSAFRFVLSNPSVDGLVVTMTSPEMIDEYVEASGSGAPKPEDLALLARYEAINAGKICQIGCAECLDSCPASVPIPDVMRMRMYAVDYAVPRVAEREYAALSIAAEACLACSGAPCAKACPHGLDISSLNRDTHRRLS